MRTGCRRSTTSSYLSSRIRNLSSGRHLPRRPTPSTVQISSFLNIRGANTGNDRTSLALSSPEPVRIRLIGSYGALEGGLAGEALQDLTGGLLEKNDLSRMTPAELNDLFDMLLKYQSRATLMSPSLEVCRVCAPAPATS